MTSLVAVLAFEASAQTQVASLSGALPPEPEIGSFTAVTNTVERRYDSEAFALGQRGGRTFANEAVRALDASSASIRLDDGTVLDVGPNSELTLDSFIYDPERGEQRLSLRFLSGIVRFTTGSMEKQAYEINTPVGSLTIRGTITLPMEEALHLVLNEGAITLELFGGEARISTPLIRSVGFSVVDGSFITLSDSDGALTEAMNALELSFDRPNVHSSVVSDYMTASSAGSRWRPGAAAPFACSRSNGTSTDCARSAYCAPSAAQPRPYQRPYPRRRQRLYGPGRGYTAPESR